MWTLLRKYIPLTQTYSCLLSSFHLCSEFYLNYQCFTPFFFFLLCVIILFILLLFLFFHSPFLNISFCFLPQLKLLSFIKAKLFLYLSKSSTLPQIVLLFPAKVEKAVCAYRFDFFSSHSILHDYTLASIADPLLKPLLKDLLTKSSQPACYMIILWPLTVLAILPS